MKPITQKTIEDADRKMFNKTLMSITDAFRNNNHAEAVRLIQKGFQDEKIYSWEYQKKPFPLTGIPGINYFKGVLGADDDRWVNCLLRYNDNGELIGILNHYPFDFSEDDKKGDFTVLVKPDMRGKGIAKELIEEGMKQFAITSKVVTDYYNLENPILLINLL
jgi:RimJ/RimL family protein N-acetyltransferase